MSIYFYYYLLGPALNSLYVECNYCHIYLGKSLGNLLDLTMRCHICVWNVILHQEVESAHNKVKVPNKDTAADSIDYFSVMTKKKKVRTTTASASETELETILIFGILNENKKIDTTLDELIGGNNNGVECNIESNTGINCNIEELDFL